MGTRTHVNACTQTHTHTYTQDITQLCNMERDSGNRTSFCLEYLLASTEYGSFVQVRCLHKTLIVVTKMSAGFNTELAVPCCTRAWMLYLPTITRTRTCRQAQMMHDFKGMKEFEVGDDDFAGLDCTLHVNATKSFPKYASTPAEPCIIVAAPHNFRLTLR